MSKQNREDPMESFNDDAHSGQPSHDRLLQGEYTLDVSSTVQQAWELLWQDPGKYIGFSLVMLAVYLVEQIILTVLDPQRHGGGYQDYTSVSFWIQSLIVFLISIFMSLVTIPLYVGVNVVAFKQMSDQERVFGDFFHGYRYWSSLIASVLMQGLIVIGIIIVPAVVVAAFALGFSWNTSQNSSTAVISMIVVVAMFLSIVPLLYIAVSYTFTQMLIIDRRLGFWQAMEMSRKVVTKRWFSVFGLVIVAGLLNTLGVLALMVGLLVTIPLSHLTLAVAYKNIFGLQSNDW
jgi:hypothetical protein